MNLLSNSSWLSQLNIKKTPSQHYRWVSWNCHQGTSFHVGRRHLITGRSWIGRHHPSSVERNHFSCFFIKCKPSWINASYLIQLITPVICRWVWTHWRVSQIFGATLYNKVGELCTVLDDWCMKERAFLFAFVSDWHDNFQGDVFDFCQTGFPCLLEIPK